MKKIGFIDYYISEWHADNYPAWIKAASERLGLDYEVRYAYASKDVSPVSGLTTDEWCEKFGIEKCESIDEITAKSDYLIILAPSNPEEHLALAKETLKAGKLTYIDKTFAPDLATAKEIFSLSEANGANIFSSSALRYATELSSFSSPTSLDITGGGGNLPEYIIHQIEIAVTLIGRGAVSVRMEKAEDEDVATVSYNDGRSVTLRYFPKHPFSVLCDGGERVKLSSDFFGGLIENILRFFESEYIPVAKEDTLEVMAIREAVIKAYENPGQTVKI